MDDLKRFPFLFGTQYYRAPTPEPACWETDLANIRALGFNAVKFFVQWRWSHRAPGSFYFEDLDRLMDLAGQNGLGVTLNFILDVAPTWLYTQYPDARQVNNHGQVIEPYAVGHRQVGGHPGPCYRHPGALAERQMFVSAAVEHFRDHPAMQMWDVWNEPELSFPQRTPDLATMVCYCPHCQAAFRAWLQAKYPSLDQLNTIWGRCYASWEQVEVARDTGTITDFIDWREFHLDSMSAEAAWRLTTTARLDPQHGRYLHVVPNSYFSAVTCADDFAMAEHCEVFAATMTGGPTACMHVVSAGRGKVCYNVESHINHGCTDMHQPIVELPDLLRDLLPQLGMGIKGFLYWQYRAETLGFESPAWGLVRMDGSPRPVTAAVQQFWARLQPHTDALRRAFPPQPEAGIWRSRKNEIFHFCLQKQVGSFNAGIDAYIQALYWHNLPFGLVNDQMLADGQLDHLKLLILPTPYYLSQPEIDALDRWVRRGGVLLCEAHLAGYNASTGRHSQHMPGGGLAEAWGVREEETTSPYHLRQAVSRQAENDALPADVRKALQAFGAAGGEEFPIVLEAGPSAGSLIWGSHRFASLKGEGINVIGRIGGGAACLAHQRVGAGQVFYCGTNLGQAAGRDPSGLQAILSMAADAAGLTPHGDVQPLTPGSVHIDTLSAAGRQRFAVVINRTEQEQVLQAQDAGQWQGLFSESAWELTPGGRQTIPPGFTDIFVISQKEEK
jgi:beta-galactosidase